MNYFGRRTHDYLGIRDLRRRNEQFVLKNHIRDANGNLVSLAELRESERFQKLDRREQRRLERLAKDGVVLSEDEGNALVNPETGKVTDDFAKQDSTLGTKERLERALKSQGMKERADAFNRQQAEKLKQMREAKAEPVARPDDRGKADDQAALDEEYISRSQLEGTTSEEADLLVSEIEQFYPAPVMGAGNN